MVSRRLTQLICTFSQSFLPVNFCFPIPSPISTSMDEAAVQNIVQQSTHVEGTGSGSDVFIKTSVLTVGVLKTAAENCSNPQLLTKTFRRERARLKS